MDEDEMKEYLEGDDYIPTVSRMIRAHMDRHEDTEFFRRGLENSARGLLEAMGDPDPDVVELEKMIAVLRVSVYQQMALQESINAVAVAYRDEDMRI